MANLTRVASNVCIYWLTHENSPSVVLEGSPGRCHAYTYFSPARISCYNKGKCNGSGTCRNCSAYDVGGLKISHKDTQQVYTDHFLQVWNDEQNKYLPVRSLTADEASDISHFINTLTHGEQVSSSNYSGLQVPINLSIYNLRASFKKCCNWTTQPVVFEKSRGGILYAVIYSSSFKITVPYLATNTKGEYTNIGSIASFCKLSAVTLPWLTPFTEQNPYAYGCNGCKPECPYYTGPLWTYCRDGRMELGDRISASQVLELRYYSDDWASMEAPKIEWNKRFKSPDIWAWTGGFQGIEAGADIDLDAKPMVKRVHIDNFSTKEPLIVIDPPVETSNGLVVNNFVDDEIVPTVSYPTLIQELSDVARTIKIAWPKAPATSPYVYRTFRQGQNIIRIFVETPHYSNVVAINITKYPQGSFSDKDFLDYMQGNFPDDVIPYYSTTTANDLIYFDVPLVYKGGSQFIEAVPGLNVIKVFVPDLRGETGKYLTVSAYIKHKFYHAMLAQTRGDDLSGHQEMHPWVDRFEHVELEAKIMKLVNYPRVHKVLWDTHAGGKLTTYQIEEVIEDELQVDWDPIYCNLVAINFLDGRCNCVTPWLLSGTSTYGVPLRVYVDRTENAKATEGIVQLEVYYKSSNGQYLQGNVVIAGPVSGTSLSSSLDPLTDKIYATYSVTEYKQGPVLSQDVSKLKYPDLLANYIDEMPIEVSYNEEGDTFSVSGTFVKLSGPNSLDKVYNLEDHKNRVYRELVGQEGISLYSFRNGGLEDGSIKASSQIFESEGAYLENSYAGNVFSSDGTPFSLSRLCEKLSEVRLHEGSYTFTVMFKDEDGRLIGIKRISLLVQSAFAETRDVEIKYKWSMATREWPIVDSMLLLAKYNEPIIASSPEGSINYSPMCGDHSETMGSRHFFGDPGPMWYPYSRCLDPKYDNTSYTDEVKCKNYVEGFSSQTSGKRWSYWERMRGPDKFYTWNAGGIYILGCFYRSISYTYETVGEQEFVGYTRIRSLHMNGPYAKDREALHINRHYIKRNLKVRDEVIQRADDPNTISWTDEYSQLLFTDGGVERVGEDRETAIWSHINDNASEVSTTTEDIQHPFTHYLLKTVGNYSYDEVFNTGLRVSLDGLFSDRDLTSTQQRNPVTGTLIYKPGEPMYTAGLEQYDDILPVFSEPSTAWSWMEVSKDPVRGSPRVTGIRIYAPSSTEWKQDKTSATHSDEGIHTLYYSPPAFNDSGVLVSLPYVSWDDGPERPLNWYAGRWRDSGTVYEYSSHTNVENFKLFGVGSTSTGSSFLIDSSGIHQCVLGNDNAGVVYGYTYRGVGVNSLVSIFQLPSVVTDFIEEDLSSGKKVELLNSKFSNYTTNTITIPLKGYFYVDSVDITYNFGPYTDELGQPIRYDIPGISVMAAILVTENGETSSNRYVEVANRGYQRITTGEVSEGEDDEGTVFTYQGLSSKKIVYQVGMFCDHVVVSYSSLETVARASISSFRIWYRKPIEVSESVYSYERKFNYSSGNYGTHDYRNMLYYYNRTYRDYGDDLAYTVSSNTSRPSVKLTNRNIKDVILEYEFVDPTYTRFAYKSEIRPENNPLAAVDVDGLRTIPGSISVCTKGRTLIAGIHKNDCPQYRADGSLNTRNVAFNETSTCSSEVGNKTLNEGVQECLYNEARNLAGRGDIVTVYDWFWHPDEVEFWENTVGISLGTFNTQLTMTSKVAEFNKVWEHESFGCASDLSVPYYDGYVHPIGKWQAMGHILEVTSPLFNESCWDVVVTKEGKHLGESTYGTKEYGSLVGKARWPYEAAKDSGYYLAAGLIMDRRTYEGGSIGGAGIWGIVIDHAKAAGNLPQQRSLMAELNEEVYSGREMSVRADAPRTGF